MKHYQLIMEKEYTSLAEMLADLKLDENEIINWRAKDGSLCAGTKANKLKK